MEARHDDSVEDAALARRIMLDRDASAEALLCQRFLPRARAYGLRHLRDAAAASDLAQDVMVLLLEALRAGRVEEPDRLAAFTMGICRHTVLQWKTGDRRRLTLLERFGPELASAVGTAPTIVDKDKLALCFDRLGARERTIVVMTYFADLDGQEIAEELAMSMGNVRVARLRALRHLHDCVTGGAA